MELKPAHFWLLTYRHSRSIPYEMPATDAQHTYGGTMDHISNVAYWWSRQRSGLLTISDILRHRRMSLFGHVANWTGEFQRILSYTWWWISTKAGSGNHRQTGFNIRVLLVTPCSEGSQWHSAVNSGRGPIADFSARSVSAPCCMNWTCATDVY